MGQNFDRKIILARVQSSEQGEQSKTNIKGTFLKRLNERRGSSGRLNNFKKNDL